MNGQNIAEAGMGARPMSEAESARHSILERRDREGAAREAFENELRQRIEQEGEAINDLERDRETIADAFDAALRCARERYSALKSALAELEQADAVPVPAKLAIPR